MEAALFKGFISQCYAILLQSVLKQHPLKLREKWEADVGQLDREQWEEIFQAVGTCSLNVSQILTRLCILLQIYYTTHRLHLMNLQSDSTCTRCKRDHGDLIHLLWRCPKLHTYWAGVMTMVNSVFKVSLPQEPKGCLLGALEEYEWEVHIREAIHIVLFQARKQIMTHWKS